AIPATATTDSTRGTLMRIGTHVAAPGVSSERALAVGRVAVAVALGLILPLHHAAWTPGALVAVALLLTSAAPLLLRGASRRTPELLRAPRVLFGVETLAACLVAAAYPSPDALSWLGFVGLVCSGAARWTLNGATAGYGVYVLAGIAISHVEGAAFSMAGAAGIRVGIIGLTSTVIGVFARSAAQFRALQARTDALAESQEALRSIIDTSPAAVVTVDAAGVVQGWSRRAEELFRRAAADVTGHHLDLVLQRTGAEGDILATAGGDVAVEATAQRGDGTEVAVEMVVSEPLRLAGEVRHAVFVTDISVRKRVELRKEVQARVVRVFVESPTLGIGVERFLDAMCTQLGWQAGRIWQLDLEHRMLRLMHAYGGDGVDCAALDEIDGELRFKRGTQLAGAAWEQNAPVVARTADMKRTPRRRALDAVGDMLGAIGAQAGLFMERRLEEAAHRETAVRLQSLLDSVGDGIITFDETGAIESANHAAGRLFGCAAEQLTRTTLDVLLAPERRSGITARLERGAMDWETEGLRRDGTMFPMELRASEMRLGGRRLFIATLRDTSELKARTMALQHQAMHDNLTGLPNRTLLTDRLVQAINSATRAGR